jgi:hypothetical protein
MSEQHDRRSLFLQAYATTGTVRGALRLLKDDYGVIIPRTTARGWAAQSSEEIRETSSIEAVTAENSGLRRQLKLVQQELGNTNRLSDDILNAITAFSPPALRYRPPTKPTSETPAVVCFGDWHVGEVIRSEDTNGLNECNFDILVARMEYLVSKLINWVETERNGHHIPDLYILVLGDLITGDIHEGLLATNEFPAPEQVVRAASLLAEAVHRLSPFFRHVYVYECTVDNHGRITKKSQWQGGGPNSYNLPLYELANAYLSDCENITTEILYGYKSEINIGGQILLVDHGHGLTSQLGLPYYGMDREEGREAKARQKAGAEPYHLHVRAHWHCPAYGPFGVVNGALCGMTGYDSSKGRYAEPAQVSFLIHPVWGMFNFVPWNLAGIE